MLACLVPQYTLSLLLGMAQQRESWEDEGYTVVAVEMACTEVDWNCIHHVDLDQSA